jgi:sec-independent protein translocase protein TatB
MLGIGMQEIIIILVVALIVIGPKKLPDLARALGRALAEFRRAADNLKEDLDLNGVKEVKEKLLKDLQQSPTPKQKVSTAKDHKEPPPAGETAKENKGETS